MEQIDISEFTAITAVDGDYLLLSRADGSAARVSVANLKSAFRQSMTGDLDALADLVASEAGLRQAADIATAEYTPLALILKNSVGATILQLFGASGADPQSQEYPNGRMGLLTPEDKGLLNALGGGTYATAAALQAEAARATAEETAIRDIANGTSAESVWNMALKVVTFGDGAVGLIPTINNLLVDTSKNTHGTYLLRYSTTGSNLLLLQGGLNIDNYPTNASRGVTQIVIGNVIVTARPDIAGTGTTWADAGVPNGVAVGHGSTNVLCRRLYYSGTTRVITPWREYVSYYANVSFAQNLEISDVVMRPLYLAGNTPIAMQDRKVSYNASTGMYSLNGLTDITPSEMLAVYEATHVKIAADPRGLFNSCAMRTNMPWNVYNIQCGNAGGNLTSEYYGADNMFARCSSLEVVEFCSQDMPARFHSYRMCFYQCLKLRRVGRMDFNYITSASSVSTVEPKPRTLYRCFYGCAELEEVRIENLKISGLSFANSPNLSAASVSYLIEHAANTSAITVTVHSDTWDNIDGESGDWATIRTDAAAKNITFVSA